MNEEIATQESLPATMQEAYDSLMESINEDSVREYNEEGYADLDTINSVLDSIRMGLIASLNVIGLDGVPNTYKIADSSTEGVVGRIFVNEHFKSLIEVAWAIRATTPV